MIPDDFLARVTAATDIIAVIQARVRLRKRGKDYVGLCPFHDEKSPSFHVSPDKQFYYCFGCAAHGNAIGFLMQYEHLPFVEAVTSLAAPLGLDVPLDDSQGKEKREAIKNDLPFLVTVNHYYQQQLKSHARAIAYLKQRGLSGHIAKHFQLGVAPESWDSIVHVCKTHSIGLEVAMRNGLVIQKENGHYYDRFRDRIMFPIRNAGGETIAFGGRTMGNDTPKYINSPETPLFHKSSELYGLYELLQHSRNPASIIIVEGYMDVIALHQYGITQVVATLGTATNPQHLKKLFRYTKEVIFCFDGDSAGQKAAWRALTTNLASVHDGVQLRFMFLPAQDDPDSLIRRVGQAGFLQRVQRAEPLSHVFFELLKQEIPLHTPDTKAMFADKALVYLNQIPAGIFRELMMNELAKQLNIYVAHLKQGKYSEKSKATKKNGQQALNPVQKAIALLLQEPALCYQEVDGVDLIELAEIDWPGTRLFTELMELLRAKPTLLIGEILNYFSQEETKQEIAMLAARPLPFDAEGVLAEFKDTLGVLQKRRQELKIEELMGRLKAGSLSTEEKQQLGRLVAELKTGKHILDNIST